MPLYRCTVAAGLTSREQRERIAGEVVRVHCGVTGAPTSFVHAFFEERPEPTLPPGQRCFVLGSIRAGRSDAQKRQIAADLGQSIAKVLGLDASEVGVATADVPASWIMEGGELLPEPGDEAAWLARHRD